MATTVRMAHSKYGAANALVNVAVAAGCFARRDIDAVTIEVPRNSDAIALLESGETELAIAPGVPVLESALRGADPLIVLSLEGENLFGVLGAAQARGPADLRGSSVGISGPQDQDALIMLRALKEWGLEPGTDVELRQIANRGDQWQALQQGEISAMAGPPPWPVLCRAAGLPVLRDFGATPEPYQLGAFVTTRRFATDAAELLRAYLAGAVEGVGHFQRDFDAVLPHLRARSKLEDVDVLRETHRIFSHALESYVPAVEALSAVARDLAALTGRTIDLDVAGLVDGSVHS